MKSITPCRAPGTRLFQGFVVLLPALHAFAPSPWLPIPLAYMMVAAVALMVFAPSLRLAFVLPADIPLFVCIALGILAMVLNAPFVGPKNVTTTAAWLVTVVFFFLFVRNWLLASPISVEDVSKAAAIACVGLSLYIIAEFVAENAFHVDVASHVFPNLGDLKPIDVIPGWRRPRGLAAEPGFSAMVIEGLLPVAWIRYGRGFRSGAFLLVTVLPGFMLLASVGSLVSVALALSVIVVARAGTLRAWAVVALAWLVVLLAALQTDAGKVLFDEVVLRKLAELVHGGAVESGGSASRFQAYHAGFQILLHRPLGIGWGMVSEMYAEAVALPGLPFVRTRGLLSLYLETAVSSGWIGLVALLLFLGTRVSQILAIKGRDATCILAALLTLLFHHAVVLEFWFPMLWLALSLSDCMTHRAAVKFAAKPSMQWQRGQDVR